MGEDLFRGGSGAGLGHSEEQRKKKKKVAAHSYPCANHQFSWPFIIPIYIKDSTDVMNTMAEIKAGDIFLVALDVQSLSTNIPHERGPDALGFFLQHGTDFPPSELICELASLGLELNCFSFLSTAKSHLYGLYLHS